MGPSLHRCDAARRDAVRQASERSSTLLRRVAGNARVPPAPRLARPFRYKNLANASLILALPKGSVKPLKSIIVMSCANGHCKLVLLAKKRGHLPIVVRPLCLQSTTLASFDRSDGTPGAIAPADGHGRWKTIAERGLRRTVRSRASYALVCAQS